MRMIGASLLATLIGGYLVGAGGLTSMTSAGPTYYRDVTPILQGHCVVCHRVGGIAPISFETYEQTAPYADSIQTAAQNRSMPPWFAVAVIGRFSNDPSLSANEIATLAAWAAAKAPAGDPRGGLAPRVWAEGWSIPQPDLVVK